MDNRVIKFGFMHGLASVTYVALVAFFMSNVGPRLGFMPEFFAALFVLTLLVVSAAIMAMLVFGRPVMWFLNGKKQEAVQLALSTVGFIIAIAVVIFAIVLVALPYFA